MRIAYCTNVRLPSERAHGHQVAQVCDALSLLGHAVTVFAPFRNNPVKEDYRTYYGARRDIVISYLNRFDPINHLLFPGVSALWTLNALLRRSLRRALQEGAFDLLYTRSPALLPALLASGMPTVLELHQLPRRGRKAFVRRCNQCRLVVCLTSPMKQELASWGIPENKIVIEGDGVDMSLFGAIPSRDEAVRRWDIPPGSAVVGYAGQLRSMGLSKGIEVLVHAVSILIERHIPIYAIIAGGPETVRKEFESNMGTELRRHVRFTGILPHKEIPLVYAAADVLVYPAPASDHPFYRRDTSPLKIFEYMAAGKPIVSADLPPIRDILDERCALLVTPGDAHALAGAIEQATRMPAEAAKRASEARSRVVRYSWEERMRRILESVKI